jgi:hypothetical protein
MINLFKKIFNKDTEITEKAISETLSEKKLLDILANSISDVGYWSWWTTDLPTLIQIEFGGTQFFFSQNDSSIPPLSQIAIQFRNPKSISFLTNQEIERAIQANWFDDLHNDIMEVPTCNSGYFTFTDKQLQKDLIKQAESINTIHGYSPKESSFYKEKYRLVFWAGDYGFAVSADEMKLFTKDGEVQLEEIPNFHTQWWAYWQRYWDSKRNNQPMPEDYACEVTIPVNMGQ